MSDGEPTSIRQRLQEQPGLLVGGAAGIVALMVTVVLVVVLTGGGGDSEDIVSGDASGSATPTATASATSTPAPTPAGPLPEVTDVAPDLDFFGELAAVHSHPVTATVGPEADSLSLADGATIDVPAGAFPAATELSVAIIDLLFEDYLTNPPEARIYVLSTEADIVLGAPLVLEVPKPADSVNATRFVDGEWLPLDVPAGPTTRIEISHVSAPAVGRGWSTQTPLKQTIAVSDNFVQESDEPTVYDALRADIESSYNAVGAKFLIQCSVTVATLFRNAKIADSEFLFLLGLSACVQALSDSGLLDQGDELNLDCVTARIDAGETIEQAADECTPKQNDDPEPDPDPQPDPEPDPDLPASKITGTLAPGIASSNLTPGLCIERPADDEIVCDFTFNVSMDFIVSGLPARVFCVAEHQGADPSFVFLGGGVVKDQLSSLDGIVSLAPLAGATFERSSRSPKFSNPVFIECVLDTPEEGEEVVFRQLDEYRFAFDLPNVDKIDGCFGFGCPAP